MFPQVFGKYVLEREVGAGGMARVYLATLRGAGGFEKRLVIKQIRAELASDAAFVRRFVEEAKTAVELSHPNIVPVYELGVEQGVYYIAMELCAGETLSQILLRTGALEPHEGAYIGVEICRALGYAHRRAGIVHRDVTPRNVLIDDEGAVRLIDFGIAAPVGDGSTSPREIFGSPGHMPPEQLRGAELTPATDVFAVAALLLEAWTGSPPFRRATAEESARMLKEPVAPLTDRIPELEPIAIHVAACLELEPSRRPQSADELARPLREYLKSVDLGDVARRLGDRVRLTRQSSPSGEARAARDSGPTQALAGVQPQTRTFAARDEWSAWTRKLEPLPSPLLAAQQPQDGSGPATRRLSQPGGAAPQAQSFRRLTVLSAAAVLVVSTVGFTLGRSSRESGSTVPALVQSSEAARPSASPRPDTPAPAAPSAPAEPSVGRAPSSPIVRSATLRLTADPPSQVSVEGDGVHETRGTPVRALSLKPGRYRVSFRNTTYGAPVAVDVKLSSGASRSVHADFREVEPRVMVR